MSKETQQDGNVSSGVYRTYIRAVKSEIFVNSVALLFIVAQATQGTVDYFVSIW